MKSYQIHLIRHGITDGNLAGQYIGSTDLSLCQAGKDELRALTDRFEYPAAEAYFVSPMKRCVETLDIIYPEAKGIAIDGLRECDFGAFEGMTAAELQQSKSFAEWMAADADTAPPNGESGRHFSERVCNTFELVVNGLMKTGVTSSVIVTHGGVISMLMAIYGLPKASPTEWATEPGHGYSVRIHPQLWMSGKVVEVYERIPGRKKRRIDDDE
ncbi:MAG: histidine phosphatase family protein [Ruminococcaceae bacterium]|nr:histidine phosphatase family protein [Oscillospiraceae bacterium]